MSDYSKISDLAETNPEDIGSGANPAKKFKYIDLSLAKSGRIDWNKAASHSLSTAPSRARRILRSGDVLFGTVRPNLQSHGYVDHVGETPLVGSTGFSVIRAKSGLCDSRYLYHCIMGSDILIQANRDAVGSSYPALNDSDVRQFKVFAPPVEEQAVIASVLDTLDTTIRQTEAIIEKLKQVKQGLLHDLLTRGIDANGELRPPQSEAPELYKESALGWIPRGWNVSSLKEILAPVDPAMRSGPFGSALLKDELVSSGYPLLGIDNVQVEHFLAEFSRFVTEKKFNELARYAVRPHDLMITIMGTVGRCCTVPKDIGNALSSKHTWTLTLDQTKYLPTLAMLQINYAPWVLKQFAEDEQGGIMSAIRSDTLRKLILPTPPIEEQHEIELRLNSITNRIEAESVSLAKSKLEKSGLMDDLLTGRVRVTPLLESQAA